ncbi:MAG: glycosyltransferase family 2 protein [Vicinamibacteria bacterium]
MSVVVTCFNLGRYLEEAVDSVFAQTLQDFEVIIVDDGSTDPDTRDLLARWNRPRTEVVAAEHRGLPAARNTGIRRARGDYICALDADDRLDPSWLERAAEVLDRDRQITFVSHWFRTFGAEEWEWTPERCDLVALLDRNTVNGAALVRREALLEAGLFDEEMKDGCEDWDLWINLVEHGHRGVIIPRFLFQYRRRSDSMSWGMPERHLSLFRRLIEKHEASYRAHLLELFQRRELAICDLRRQMLHLDEEYHGWFEPELDRRRREVGELRAKLDGGSRTESQQLRLELERLAHAHQDARNEVAALHASLSWRVTSPLRWIYGQLLRLTGVGKA